MPKSLVVDASFGIRLILPDPRRASLRARMERWALAESMQCDLWTANQRLHSAVNLPWVRLAW